MLAFFRFAQLHIYSKKTSTAEKRKRGLDLLPHCSHLSLDLLKSARSSFKYTLSSFFFPFVAFVITNPKYKPIPNNANGLSF